MRGAKKRQALPAIVLLLLASAPPPPAAECRDVPAAGAERGALLDLLLQALDGGRPLPPRPPRRDRLISRRYSGAGAPPPDPLPIAAAPRPPPAVPAVAAAPPPPPRLFSAVRHGEIFPRDSSLKDKFIKHFTGNSSPAVSIAKQVTWCKYYIFGLLLNLDAIRNTFLGPSAIMEGLFGNLLSSSPVLETGPVTFSSECSKHFHRLYHNTRDCSTPAYYKRCARLLTRLAMSPLCTQS